jgi:hypothetical protein
VIDDIKEIAKAMLRAGAWATLLTFYMFGIVWKLPPFLTMLAESPDILVNTVLSLAIVVWVIVVMVVLLAQIDIRIFSGVKEKQ